ncbi:MAG: hypothetical protein ACK4Y5_00715 [Acetobacteraceae bacterium]|jgi:hypothetical protein
MKSSPLERLIVLILTFAFIPVLIGTPPLIVAVIWYFARDSVAAVFSWPSASTITFSQAFWLSLLAYVVGVIIFRLVRAIFPPAPRTT